MVYLIAIISAISGFLFGYDEGIISGFLHLLIKEFSMSALVTGMVTSALPFGAVVGSVIIGALLTSVFVRRIGRRLLLLVVANLYTLGGIIIAFAPNSLVLTLARSILGLAIGASAIVTPLFISETAPTIIRGRLITIYQLAITLGILISYAVNYFLVKDASWHAIYATVIIPAVFLLIGVFFLPESPRWLVLKGNDDEAKKVLNFLRKNVNQTEINTEFEAIKRAVSAEKPTSWSELFSPLHRPVVTVGIMLFLLQQLSGINAVIYYAPIIFANTGFVHAASQNLATLIIGVVNFLTTILAMVLVERLGRFYLLLIGFVGTAISLGLIFFGSLLHFPQMNWLSLFALIAYIIFFAVSLGPLPYVLMSEIFPLNIRGAGMSVSSISNWVFNAIVVFLFPLLAQLIGIANFFGIFAFICLLGVAFTISYVPETKGISLEQIETYVNSGKPLSRLGRNN